MTSEERRDEYLAKAKDAEKQAANTKDSTQSTAWVRIAEGYRALAMAPRP
jgi:hypothetical protein